MTQPFVALRANAAANASDLGGGMYQTVLTVADDSSVYNGTDVAIGFKFIKAGSGGQMRVYDIVSVDSAFVTQVTITVDDTDSNGTPGFGAGAIVQPNSSGQFPVVSGIDQGLQQAITQYNLQFGGGNTIYTADDSLTEPRTIAMSGHPLKLDGGDLEITENLIREDITNARWEESLNELGVATRTKL